MRIPSFEEKSRYTVAIGTSDVLADRLDGRRHVAALEEQRPRRVDDCSPGEPRAGLTNFGLDQLGHETIVSLSV